MKSEVSSASSFPSRRDGARSLGSRRERDRCADRFVRLDARVLAERGLDGRERDPRGELLLLRPNAGGDRELRVGTEQRGTITDARAVGVSEPEYNSDGRRRDSAEQR